MRRRLLAVVGAGLLAVLAFRRGYDIGHLDGALEQALDNAHSRIYGGRR